jgi:hypothetical protein
MRNNEHENKHINHPDSIQTACIQISVGTVQGSNPWPCAIDEYSVHCAKSVVKATIMLTVTISELHNKHIPNDTRSQWNLQFYVVYTTVHIYISYTLRLLKNILYNAGREYAPSRVGRALQMNFKCSTPSLDIKNKEIWPTHLHGSNANFCIHLQIVFTLVR